MVPSAAAWFAETPSPSPGAPRYIDPSTIGPGVIGFLLLLFLGLATFLLWRSMNRQLKKIDFDEGVPEADAGASAPGEPDAGRAKPDQAGDGAR